MSGCRFERDVLAAVAAGTWEQAPPELAAHVATCSTCADLAFVSTLLKEDHASTVARANVPSSGQVWWRAQVRARAEAAQAAARPLFVAQALAAAAVIGALVALVTWLWPAGGWRYVSLPTELGTIAWVGLGAWAILAPVALYLVFAREPSD
jgi:hypothetical protein